jgi:hypothetical protein
VADACLATLAEGHAGVESFDAQLCSAVALQSDAATPAGTPSPVVTWVLGEFVRQLEGASLWWTADGQRVRSHERWPQPQGSGWLFVDAG